MSVCDSRGTGELCAPQRGRARHDFSLAWLETEGDLSEGVDWRNSKEAGSRKVV